MLIDDLTRGGILTFTKIVIKRPGFEIRKYFKLDRLRSKTVWAALSHEGPSSFKFKQRISTC